MPKLWLHVCTNQPLIFYQDSQAFFFCPQHGNSVLNDLSVNSNPPFKAQLSRALCLVLLYFSLFLTLLIKSTLANTVGSLKTQTENNSLLTKCLLTT